MIILTCTFNKHICTTAKLTHLEPYLVRIDLNPAVKLLQCYAEPDFFLFDSLAFHEPQAEKL